MESESPKEFLYKEYQDIFEFTEQLIQNSPEAIAGKIPDTLPKAVTTYHYVRAINLLDAIYVLCLHGYATEAMVLLRSLFNLFVNLKWLLYKDVKARTTRYADFEAIYKKLTLDNLYKYSSFSKTNKKKDFEVHDKDFERVKKKYGLKNPKDFYEWSGTSIFKMAKEVGLERDYHIVYSNLSQTEHTGPAPVRQYLDDSEHGVIGIRVGPKKGYVDVALLTSLEYFLPTKRITFEMFGIDQETLEKECQKLMELNSKYRNL